MEESLEELGPEETREKSGNNLELEDLSSYIRLVCHISFLCMFIPSYKVMKLF